MRKFAVLVLVACSPKQETPPPPPVADAAIDAPPGITTIATFDPASGMHLDDDGTGSSHVAPRPTTRRPGRPIEVTLRSTPPNASASVDGQPIGNTPAFWQGEANGREHEFTFTLRGHATARYRFVPVQSGVVHARLERTGDDTTPASAPVPAPAPVTPVTPPTAPTPVPKPVPPPPPPTVLSIDAAEPVDAASAPVPADAAPTPAD